MENPRNSEGTIRTIKWICLIACVLEIAFVAVYFFVFSGGISTANQDWDTFTHIFNGLIMSILTTANIYIFYKLTKAIEDKNQERAVKEKVFEAQSVITQMRVRQYEEIRSLIYDALSVISHKRNNNGEIDLLHSKLVEIDNSLLFKSHKLFDSTVLEDASLKIIAMIQKFQCGAEVDLKQFGISLTAYLKLMETYMISQMISDNDVVKYVSENAKNLDCTFDCVIQVLDRTLEELEKQEYIEAK